MSMLGRTEEDRRLKAAWSDQEPWLRWGPYLSERQWGTVREDYSPSGNAWDSFPHDHARSRAYRWGEDGLAGLCDDRQRLCFALALWNGRDPIIKERLFGLTNSQGNHGEDVKEYYFYQDSAPTHSYMRYLYKYPQAAYPYDDLINENGRRKATAPGALEYELMDTGVFDDEGYFDVTVEYAKVAPDDIYIRITAVNRGPDAETLWLLPTLWFRNTWSWRRGAAKPRLAATASGMAIDAHHDELGERRLLCPDADDLWFVDNETNARRLYGVDGPAYPKDGINDRLVHGAATVNPAGEGTKAAAVYERRLAAGEGATITLRLTDAAGAAAVDAEAVFAQRLAETDAFYASRLPADLGDDRRSIARQAYAGMLWSKQYFHYVVAEWLDGDELAPPPSRLHGRNSKWRHVYADDVLSMPDTWEYPWFASWDLGFHTVALARVDLDFAKQQILLLCREWYMSPEGQVPAYEWAFDDVNPPVQAWAALQIAEYERRTFGTRDLDFLRSVFDHGLLYFTWWVNRKDADGNNLFQGGFLGLDNIAAFDRSAGALPGGGRLYQADGTAWVGFFALQLMEIATELAKDDPAYLDFAAKFFQHFLYIADALDHVGRISDGAAELWSDEDGLFFDVLRVGDRFEPMKVRSLVSLLPLIAVACVDLDALENAESATFAERLDWFRRRQAELLDAASAQDGGGDDRLLLSFLGRDRLIRLLGPLLDENEFLSPYGIRSLSRRHADAPFVAEIAGERYEVDYRPAESHSGMFGGNSNWRGPVWMPVNVLLIDALRHFHRHFGDTLEVEFPTGSGVSMTLDAVADALSRRLTKIFERQADGTRAVHGGNARFQHDPHWRDNILFYEYFHGDNGAGIGASHQTGWTGLAAVLMEAHAEPPTAPDAGPSKARSPLGLRPG